MKAKIIHFFALVGLLCPFSGVSADAQKVLFIGNSYTGQNNLSGLVQKMAAALPDPMALQVQKRTPGGFTFEKHAANPQTLETLQTFKPDAVVLQEQSQMPFMAPARTQRGARALAKQISEAEVEKIVFYMTWARQHQPEKIADLSRVYLGLGNELGADVAPVGLAWQRSLAEHPEWGLHRKDKSHPNQAGSYLAACVILRALTGADVTTLPDESFGFKEVSKAQAIYFQSLAMQEFVGAAE